MSVIVTGASNVSPSDMNGISRFNNTDTPSDVGGLSVQVSRTFKLTGLTAGLNTFTLNYRSTGGPAMINEM